MTNYISKYCVHWDSLRYKMENKKLKFSCLRKKVLRDKNKDMFEIHH